MKCIIIDDEPIARKGMQRLVDSHPSLELAATFGSAESAGEWLAENSADLLFLDIEMPGISGVEFARTLPEKCMVIFTTAYSEYAVDSYEVEAVDYLMKPIRKERFLKAVERALTFRSLIDSAETAVGASAPESDFIIVRAERKYLRIRLDEILFVEGLKDYVIIHLEGRNVVTRMMVRGMEEMLPKNRFLRVSKSVIVNIDRVDSFDSKDVTIGNTELAIGLSYRDEVIEILMKS